MIAWRREAFAGVLGSVSILALVLSLGLLALAPLGAAGVAPGLRAGLTTAVVGGVLYAWLGRAALPAAGPSSATALLLAGLLLKLRADPALAGVQALPTLLGLCGVVVAASGVLQMVASALGVARLTAFVPRPVVAGFMNGVALQLALAQWPLLLGQPLGGLANTTVQPLAVLLGLCTAVAIVVLTPRWPRLPVALLALVAGTALHFGLTQLRPGLPMGASIGWLPPIDSTLPGALGFLAAGVWAPLTTHTSLLAMTALLLAGVGALETAMNGLALDRQRGTSHNPRRELMAIGATNVVLGLLGGVPAVQSRVRAMGSAAAGAQHRVSLIIGSIALGILAVIGRPLLAWLPLPVLAGILLAVAWFLADRWTLELVHRARTTAGNADARMSLALVGAVMLTTFFFGLGAGVALGALLSLMVLMVHTSRSLVRARYVAVARPSRRIRTPEQEERLQALRAHIRIVELEGALFFGSGARLLAEADALPAGTTVLIADARRINILDESGAQLLHDLQQRLHLHRVMLCVAGMRPALLGPIRQQLLRSGVTISVDLDRATEWAENQLLAAQAWPQIAVGLEQTPLLQGLDDRQRQVLLPLLRAVQLRADQPLFEEGDPGDCLYVLLSGSVSVLSRPNADGLRQRYLSISAGMMLGETALLDGQGRTAGAVADCDATLVALDKPAFETLLMLHPDIAALLYQRIAVHLSQRLRASALAWYISQT